MVDVVPATGLNEFVAKFDVFVPENGPAKLWTQTLFAGVFLSLIHT